MKTDTMYIIGNGFLAVSYLAEKGELFLLLLALVYLIQGMIIEFMQFRRKVEDEQSN